MEGGAILLPNIIQQPMSSTLLLGIHLALGSGRTLHSSNVRIVNINGWDIEACGGTHVKSTGEIGLVKIVKSERIQDGVVRLEFVAGEAAVNYMQHLDSQVGSIAQTLGSSREKVV